MARTVGPKGVDYDGAHVKVDLATAYGGRWLLSWRATRLHDFMVHNRV